MCSLFTLRNVFTKNKKVVITVTVINLVTAYPKVEEDESGRGEIYFIVGTCISVFAFLLVSNIGISMRFRFCILFCIGTKDNKKENVHILFCFLVFWFFWSVLCFFAYSQNHNSSVSSQHVLLAIEDKNKN